MEKEPTITMPLSEFENLFNLAMMMQGKEQILSMAMKRLQDAKPGDEDAPAMPGRPNGKGKPELPAP